MQLDHTQHRWLSLMSQHLSGQEGGRGHTRGRDESPTSDLPLWLSVVTKADLQRLYGITYKYTAKTRVGGAPGTLASMLGGNWEKAREIYPSLFTDVVPNFSEIPPLLTPMFDYIAATRKEGINVFGNGAGKTLASKLLSLLPIAPWVRIATTRNSQTDWCGVQTTKVHGVVDVAVVKGGVWLVVGEVKRGTTSPFTQVLAAMQAVQERDGVWPCGFTMNERSLNLLLLLPQGGNCVKIHYYSYMVFKLEQVIHFLEDLQSHLDSRELPVSVQGMNLDEGEEEGSAMVLECRLSRMEATLERLVSHQLHTHQVL